MKRLLLLLILSVPGIAQMSAQSPLADSVGGYSGEQGKQGWSYLYYVSSKDGTGTYVPEDALPMKWAANSGDAKEIWIAPQPWFSLSRESAKSRVVDDCYQGWAVRRWTSDQDGEIEIRGSAKCTAKAGDGDDAGDGVLLRVFVDGKEIFNKPLPPQAAEEFKIPTAVRRGSKVDFAITPGPGLNALFDGAQFNATIGKAVK